MEEVDGNEEGIKIHEKMKEERGVLIGLAAREFRGDLPRSLGPFTPGKIGDCEERAPIVRRPVMQGVGGFGVGRRKGNLKIGNPACGHAGQII